MAPLGNILPDGTLAPPGSTSEPFDGPAPNPVGVKIGHVEKGIAKLPQLRGGNSCLSHIAIFIQPSYEAIAYRSVLHESQGIDHGKQ